MGKLNFIYNSITCYSILSAQNSDCYKNNILPAFLSSKEKYLFYDDVSAQVLLLNENDMRVHYKNGNYRDYCDLGSIDSFEDFCLSSCIEVLKVFSHYSVEELEKTFKEHCMLKSFVP